jgi:hypothetical protein
MKSKSSWPWIRKDQPKRTIVHDHEKEDWLGGGQLVAMEERRLTNRS